MTIRSISARRFLGLSVAVFLFAACGGSNDEGAASSKPLKKIELPETLVRDLSADRDVTVASLIPADRPVLLWFWAPH